MTAATADSHGNFYVVGATTAIDFPTTGAAQTIPGGSVLVRLDVASGAATRLYPANLPSIGTVSAAPASPGTLFAATGNQILRSTDAGSTWSLLSQLASGVTVVSLAVDPAASSTLYAGTFSAGIFQSLDGGVTWAEINNGIVPASNGGISVGGVWVAPSDSNVIFASSGRGLLRSGDRGNSWTPVGGGGSFSPVAFDPLSPGTVYLVDNFTVSRSTDNGITFAPLTPLPNQTSFTVLVPDPRHAGTLYAGSTGGIYASTDGGVTWNLKLSGFTSVLVADPASAAFYANVSGYGIVKSTDGFATTSPAGPNQPSIKQLILSGSNLYEISKATSDAFVVKFDSQGNVAYSTYFGGSGDDSPSALAIGPDGSLYLTGSTNSTDLPVTPGAYLSKLPAITGASSFVVKLNPDGTTAWATYFGNPGSSTASLALDSQGNVFVGGTSSGGLTTTPGAYQTTFQRSVTSNGFFSVIGPNAAFVSKLNPKGAGLIYSTYIPTDNQKNTVQSAQALVVDGAGNSWIGAGTDPNVVPTGPAASVVELNATGSAVLASAVQAGLGAVAGLALDSNSNVYVAGTYTTRAAGFPATPGTFQPAPQPAIPAFPYALPAGGGTDAFVAKWDSSLTHLLAATLLGGELPDVATSIAIDASGMVIVGGYTDSKAFPTHAPFQESFSPRAGFVAGLDANLSHLLFSTYLGDGRPFSVQAAVPDGSGNVLVAGSTLAPGNLFIGGDNGASFLEGQTVVVNQIALPAAPAVRLDSVQNYASHLAAPLAPGEPIIAVGAGFGSGAQIVLDGTPLPTIAATSTSVVAVVPDGAATSGPHTVQVSTAAGLSNAVYAPAAAASPAIYSVDGSGFGQGYILNADGTPNTPANPAVPGSAITIFAAGAGSYTLSSGYAVTSLAPSVFVDGFYCNGIAAIIGPVNGLPGNVYQLSVYVPDPAALVANNPDLKNFHFPAQVPIQLVMGPPNALNFANSPAVSQNGVFINIR